MIHFGLFFWRVYGISIYSFFIYKILVISTCLLKRLPFFHWITLAPLSKMNSLYICGFIYAWIFYIFHWSIWVFFFVCLFVFANITLSYVGFPGSGMDTNNNSAIMNQPAMQEIQGWPLLSTGWEDPLEKEMATHSSILAWETICAEQTDGLQSVRSQESDMS